MFNSLKFNIYKLYIIQASRWAMFYIPIFVLFLQENGLNMQQILTLQAIFSIAITLFEVPSGYLSDKLGRKNTIIIGSIFSFIGLYTYYSSFSFLGFLTAEILLGIGVSFVSGSDSAMLYDTLEAEGNKEKYRKTEAVYQSIGNFSESFSSIIGGFIALASLRYTFVPNLVLALIAILVSFTLKEPIKQTIATRTNPFKEILQIVKYSLKEHKEVAALIFYAGLINTCTLLMVFFIQPYLEQNQINLIYFGIIWAGLNFSVGIFSLYADKYEKLLGRKKALVSLIFLLLIGFIGVSLSKSYFGLLPILIFYFVRGISGPIVKDYVNQIISSDIRATVLSVKNLVGRLLFAILAPFIGYFSDTYSLSFALQLSAGLFTLMGISCILYLKKHKAL